MTREEAIKHLKAIKRYFVFPEIDKALDLAISALRPVSREQELEAENMELKERIVNWRKYMAPIREQVEKVWRGCEYCCGDVDDRAYIDSQAFYISGEGYLVNGDEDEDICQLLFCPKCGRPLTDEAVEMVMERLEALKDAD